MTLRRPVFISAAACALTALAAAAIIGWPPGLRLSQPRTGEQLSLLVVLIDTLRADHLGTYGYASPTSPRIDRFARGAVVFRSAVSPAPFTMPAMAAFMTGLYPDHAGVINHDRSQVLDTPMPTLAERLRAVGYSTTAVVANPWLANLAMRFDRGFDRYLTRGSLSPSPARLDAEQVTSQALASIDAAEPPFFVWAHYMDVHMPYSPPIETARLFGNDRGTSPIVEAFRNRTRKPVEIYFARDHSAADVEATRQLYDASIRYVDQAVGRLLDGLRTRGLSERTVVILAADHGESLGDHGLFFAHDFTLYEELVHVPLMIRTPGLRPRKVGGLVSLVDVVPTLCRMLELDCQQPSDGVELPLRSGRAAADRIVFAAAAPARSRYVDGPRIYRRGPEGRWTMARQGMHKLIRIPHPDADIWEAYDLRTDPGELHDDAAVAAELQRPLADWHRRMREHQQLRSERKGRRRMDSQTLEELRSFGYLH